jgi:sulfite exporter TauE/SafE
MTEHGKRRFFRVKTFEKEIIVMNNRTLYYGAIVLGIIALVVGIYYSTNDHPTREIAGIVVGAILLIIGLVGVFVIIPRSTR